MMKKNGETGHVFECAAVEYPDPGQCPAIWLNAPKKGNN